MRAARWPWVLVALLALAPAAAAEDPLDEDFNLWLEYVTAFRPQVGGLPLHLELELELRLRDDASQLDQARFEGFAGLEPLPDLVAGVGFLYSDRYSAAPGTTEYRPYLRVDASPELLGGVGVLLSLRLDVRFFDGLDPVGYRLVPRFGLEVPLPRLAGVGLALRVWDEPRFALSTVHGRQRRGFVENRGYVGLRLQLASGLTLDAGYVSRYLPGRKDETDELEHVLALGFEVTFR